MIIIDENLPELETSQLRDWGIRVRVVGVEVARLGIKDDQIIPLLHRLRGATFFTLDEDFFDRRLCHARYCLVWLDMAAKLSALQIRRFLKHPSLDTEAKRIGKVVRVRPTGIEFYEVGARTSGSVAWQDE
ncbi:MAG: hypothetical protein HY298_03180 [Verrucomicrobia bacterium]|nr:hypothetical protein [Verrucomicrobiota bacterium]